MAELFKKILKGVLIGGGTILSLLCPPAGGAVITAGMAIGAGAKAAGELIKTEKPISVDTAVSTVTSTLASIGLMKTADVTTAQGSTKAFVISPVVWLVGGLIIVFVFFKGMFKRRR